jgi:hypothetical protein
MESTRRRRDFAGTAFTFDNPPPPSSHDTSTTTSTTAGSSSTSSIGDQLILKTRLLLKHWTLEIDCSASSQSELDVEAVTSRCLEHIRRVDCAEILLVKCLSYDSW